MTRHRFSQVDVFTDTPLLGNPLAVVHDADDLSAEQMQAFARWTNLSETTFLLKPTDPEADYRVRIFSPGGELRFAGHPTLGSCHAWREDGGLPRQAGRVVQQCSIGLVPLRLEGGQAAFAAPPLHESAVADDVLDAIIRALQLTSDQVVASRVLDNGMPWVVLQLDSAERVLAVNADASALAALPDVGLVGAHRADSEARFELRAFVPSLGIGEDPVTGSLNASVAQWLMQRGVAPDAYVAAQGTRLQRAGRVHLRRDGETVWVGGTSITCVRGELGW